MRILYIYEVFYYASCSAIKICMSVSTPVATRPCCTLSEPLFNKSPQPASEGSILLRSGVKAMLTHCLSRLLFYRRIFPVREIKRVLQIAMAVVVAYFVGSLLSALFQW